jgi:DNA-binding LacI/PurR family transcriptional regulator
LGFTVDCAGRHRLAVERLINLGHIAFVGSGSETLPTGVDRAKRFNQRYGRLRT